MSFIISHLSSATFTNRIIAKPEHVVNSFHNFYFHGSRDLPVHYFVLFVVNAGKSQNRAKSSAPDLIQLQLSWKCRIQLSARFTALHPRRHICPRSTFTRERISFACNFCVLCEICIDMEMHDPDTVFGIPLQQL